MDYFASVFVFISAFLFQWRRLNIKKLSEKGVRPLTSLYYSKYAIFPSVALLVITYKTEYLHLLLRKDILILFILMSLLWIGQEFIGFYTIDSVSNLSFLKAYESLINIPIYVVIGFTINHDIPNTTIYIALALLAIAILIKPKQHIDNQRETFKQTITLVTFLILIAMIIDGINSAASRYILQNMNATLFVVAASISAIMLLLNIFFLFKKIPASQKQLAQKQKYLSYSITPLWFLASIPEGYGYYNAPIYTVLAISAFTFIMDIFSDIKNKRTQINAKTIIFILLVLASICLSVISLG